MPTRRAILTGLVVSALGLPAVAQRPPRIRYDAASPEGAQNLAKFERAVGIMMSLPASDPRSWTYQWYIHSVRGDRTKSKELARIYPTATPARQLASECWSTCQGHVSGSNPDAFLPWHRGYLLCFEQTLRNVLADPDFTLPYWNYLAPQNRALPLSFLPVSAGPLSRTDRRAQINAGSPIDFEVAANTPINAASLQQTNYRQQGSSLGFCRHIDRNLHGSVHTLIGTSKGMGAIPWAANDPIFWLHHASIDRLWASWNAQGCVNPSDTTYLERRFVFPNGVGGRASIRTGDILSLDAAGYRYDTLVSSVALRRSQAAARAEVELAVNDAGVSIGPAGGSVRLRRSAAAASTARSATSGRLVLVLAGLSALDVPGVLYDVQVRDRQSRWISVGFINFFDTVASAHAGMDMGKAPQPARTDVAFSFDVTDALGDIATRTPEVRILPVGSPERGVRVSVSRIRLVSN
jgi:tyrosinase